MTYGEFEKYLISTIKILTSKSNLELMELSLEEALVKPVHLPMMKEWHCSKKQFQSVMGEFLLY